jgi:hypothetical protein
LGSPGRAPSLTSYTLAFVLQLRKKHGKTSVRVASRTSQTDTVQYTNNEQCNTQRRKLVTQSVTMSQSNKEHRIHNRENSPCMYVCKPCVKLHKTIYYPLSVQSDNFTVFTPTTARRLDIKVYNNTASLLHVSAFFCILQGNIRQRGTSQLLIMLQMCNWSVTKQTFEL